LLQAGLSVLAERGFRGATTRLIAERAGVAELTLFRHFGSKVALLREAVRSLPSSASPLLTTSHPSDDVALDLRTLLQSYVEVLRYKDGLVLRLLPDLIRHPELVPERPNPGVANAIAGVLSVFRHHQAAGRLSTAEPPEVMALAFIGPLFAWFLVDRVFGVTVPLDPDRYVDGFLLGRGAVDDPIRRRPDAS
jgi:AcrR family transcriptional regulator